MQSTMGTQPQATITSPAVPDNWHTQPSESVLKTLNVDVSTGLTSAQVETLTQTYGPNELVERAGKTVWSILYEQMTNPLVLLLIAAAAVSGLLGKWDSFIAILAIVILNAVLGVVQEYRAEQAMAALKKMSAPTVRVRRNGSLVDVESRQVVPGDIVLMEAGSMVSADARLLEAVSMRVQEASLTGESHPVEKNTEVVADAKASLGDRHNMVYMGTSVTYGRGMGVVVSTGMRTQLGRIAELIQTVDSEKTPLQRRLDELGKVLLGAAIVVMIIALIIGLITGVPLVPDPNIANGESVLLNAVAIAVAVVPEGLPAVVTIALALGAQRMLRRRALVRKLAAVETLGSVTTICSDKTGTLTENRMTVKLVDVAGLSLSLDEVIAQQAQPRVEASAQLITLVGGALCNDAIIQPHPETGVDELIGDPTEGALVFAAKRYGLSADTLNRELPRVAEVPFDSDRKRMSTVHRIASNGVSSLRQDVQDVLKEIALGPEEFVIFTKGGVDNLVAVSQHALLDGKVVPMDDSIQDRILSANNAMATQGLRVLGVAYRVVGQVPQPVTVETIEQDLVFVGMVGIIDPPRKEVADAVQVCLTAGVRPIMITGDHPLTASAIASELGIAKDGDRTMTGKELSSLSSDQLKEVVKTVNVYARVSPENKLQIVSAFGARATWWR